MFRFPRLSGRRAPTAARRRVRPRRRPRVEDLEGRQLLSATYTVTTASDYAPTATPIVNSLRWAITQADGNAGSSIGFSIGSGGVQTINLLAPLPAITQPTILDGTTQLGSKGTVPGIVLNGAQAGSSATGILLRANNSTIKGLVIGDFAYGGVRLDGSSGDHGDAITGDFIGTDASGTKAMGNGQSGVLLADGASNNTIGGLTAGSGDVIAANKVDGIEIAGPGTSGNVVEGNFIGTNLGGTAALGNAAEGVDVIGSNGNTLGGTSASARNVISGNDDGVHLEGGTSGNVVEGNMIGTDASSEHALGNLDIGVRLDSASRNTIGGSVPGAGNVISGNGYIGVRIRDGNTSGMTDDVVEGNEIGTDAAGLVAVGNRNNGVTIDYGADGNTIGGPVAADRNIISGNAGEGIRLIPGDTGLPTNDNLVQGNVIGRSASGKVVLSNSGNGIAVWGSSGNTLSGNTISGSGADGIQIAQGSSTLPNAQGHEVVQDFDSNDNLVQANTIGGSAAAFGNGTNGVALYSGSAGNTIGGITSGARNVIADNKGSGVYMTGIVGANNLIGFDTIESNGGSGVYLWNVPQATTVADCTIELNGVYGIWMRHSVSLATTTDTVAQNVKGQVVKTSS
jgi:titin